MSKYAAFLRGINVGGHNPVPMKSLKTAMESLGFHNVRTLLASGNVICESPSQSTDSLERTIEQQVQTGFRTDHRRVRPQDRGFAAVE